MLFCKPPVKPDLLYEQNLPSGETICIRSFVLKKDLPIIHQWVNAPYAKTFWQLEGPIEQLTATYKAVLKNQDAHSYIISHDQQVVALADLYRVQADDLGKYISSNYHDCGMHLLMAPLQHPIPQLSRNVMRSFMSYFYSFEQAENLYAEPDIHNNKACRLLDKCGFGFMRNIMLTNKAASLYLMTRKKFYAAHPIP